MAKEPFMLVSLNEEKAKKLSQVLSNPTATRILDHLSRREATESEISRELDIPLSTVHYNLKQLSEAKLVVVDEFHYSSRGKEVNHYKLANKYIIIAPAEEKETFLQHMRRFLPAIIVTVGAAVVLKTMQAMTGTLPVEDVSVKLAPEAGDAAAGAMETAPMMAMQAADIVNETVAELPSPVPEALPWWQSPMVDWFLVGAVFVLLVLVVSETISWWRWKRQ